MRVASQGDPLRLGSPTVVLDPKVGPQHRYAAVGSNRVRVAALRSVSSGPLWIHCNGYQQTEQTLWSQGAGLAWPTPLPFIETLLAAGWIIASSSFDDGNGNHGEGWGNEAASQTAIDELIAHVDSLYDVTHIVLTGWSAGGLAVLNHVTAGSYDSRLRGIGLANAVSDLADIYAYNSGEFAGSIDTAYGITNPPDYATATSGYDPILEAAADYNQTSADGSKLRYVIFSSPDDTIVDKATHADALDTLIGSGGWESTVVETSGGHYVRSAYGDDDDWLDFFERAVTDWPTLPAAGTANKGTGPSVALTIPASTVEGDLLVAFVGATSSGVTATTAPGWTEHAAGTLAGFHYTMLYKVASASDEANAGSGTHTFTPDGTVTTVGGTMIHVQRSDTSDALGAFGGNVGSGTSLASGGITIDGTNRLGLACAVVFNSGTVSWPAGWSEVAETAGGGTGIMCSTAVKIQPNAGASGGVTVTLGTSGLAFVVETQIHPVDIAYN